jgi:methionyl aminopeptidase
MLIETVKPGISLIELDDKADALIQKHNGTSSFYQYNGFPKHICISVNEQLIHGVPNNYKIKIGDKITFDVGVTYKNHVCDGAYTVVVGKNNLADKISQATHQALMNAIAFIKPDNFTGDIAHAIMTTAKQYGYEVIKDFGGHGCGNKVHEDPMILNYGEPQTGVKLIKGMVLCIEPMLMTDSDDYYIDPKNK